MSTWFFTTFNVSGLKEKVHYLDGLQQLFTCIRPEQMDIPPFVLEYDARVSVHIWAQLVHIWAQLPPASDPVRSNNSSMMGGGERGG